MRGATAVLFAGGGGADRGIEAALGRPVDVAVNHDPVAIAVHRANFPRTRHFLKDVYEVAPREAMQGRPVDLLWASPDCTHFSVAKGDVPRDQGIRSLAWVVVDWAREVAPRIILLENVREFQGWGPLGRDGRPLKRRAGETFRKWVAALRKLGYAVEWRVLDASEYGAPTRRKRLFVAARRDGLPICWPAPTHGKGLRPFRTAAECIDWSIPCPSIFERKRPLAPKTQWRIFEGIRRHVLESARPFVVEMNHSNAPRDIDEPLGVVTTQGNRFNLVSPVIAKFRYDSTGAPADEPLPTVTAGGKARPHRPATGNPLGLIAPTLVRTDMHQRNAGCAYAPEDTLRTITSKAGHAVAAATLMTVGHGERPGQDARVPGLDVPLNTVTGGGTSRTGGHHALVAASLARDFGQSVGGPADEPAPTVMPGGAGKTKLVAAFLSKHYGGVVGHEVERPVGAVTGKDHHALTAAQLAPVGVEGRVAQVRAFLTAFYSTGSVGQSLHDPARTITAKHRLGLVTVEGIDYQIVDIGMRMLEPHELLRAQFGDFADGFDLSAAKTKAAKVRLIGNSVCPDVAAALVRANVPSAREAVA